MTTVLRGSTWNHVRGLSPLLATAEEYRGVAPDVQIAWEARSLQDFGSFSVTKLAQEYDLLVIDHPHLGEAAKSGALLAFDDVFTLDQLRAIETDTVGPSYDSYVLNGQVWALPIDAAAQVSVYRPDLLDEGGVPLTWDEVVRLARRGSVAWPLKPIDAICSFMSLSANRGTPLVGQNGAVISRGDATGTLEAMREVSCSISAECFSWNPIQALDTLASEQTRYNYIPLAFSYSNYARHGYAAHVLRSANIPGEDKRRGAGSLLGGAGIAVSSKCKDPAAAMTHAGWLAGSAVQRTTYVTSGGQPAAASAWEDDVANGITDDFFRRVRLTHEASWVRPRRAGFPAWQDAAGDLVNAFVSQGGDAAKTAGLLVDSLERAQD